MNSEQKTLEKGTEIFGELYAERTELLTSSFIRDILKAAQAPGVTSFAGGLPNPETFPREELSDIFTEVLKNPDSLQYGTTEGHLELRKSIADYMKNNGVSDIDEKNVLVLSGSQQALYEIPFLFLDRGDRAFIEQPTFIGALNPIRIHGFEKHGAHKVEGISMDKEGMITDSLAERLSCLEHEKRKMPKFVYTIPTFQNPTGITLTEKRRKELLNMAHQYNFLIIEDDPYGKIRFEGDRVPLIKSLEKDEPSKVVFLGTFSKEFAPIRIAYAVAHEEIIQKMTMLKQSLDLCSQKFFQVVLHEYMNRGLLDKHIQEVTPFYKAKKERMLDAMNSHFDKEHVSWVNPEGGLFTWANVEGVNTHSMFNCCLNKHKVAYVPGAAFYLNQEEGAHGMRLNFSYAKDEEIEPGIERLAECISETRKANTETPPAL